MNLDKFLKNIDEILPSICTDKDLIEKIPSFFKNPVSLFRLRQKKESPAHFQMPNGRVFYLKEDVITWIKDHYSNLSLKKSIEDVQNAYFEQERGF